MSMEIKLEKRYKYAGDILNVLVTKCGFPLEVAIDCINDMPDANVVERTEQKE